jgi:hypothetical protein
MQTLHHKQTEQCAASGDVALFKSSCFETTAGLDA